MAHAACSATVVVGSFGVTDVAREANIDIGVAFRVFLILVDSRHFVAVLAILEVVVMSTIVGMRVLIQIVEDRGTVLFHLDDVLVADCEELDDLSENSSSIGVNKARDYFISYVARRSSQHFFELGGRETLNDHIFLRLLRLVLSLEVEGVVVVQRVALVDLGQISVHVLLSQVDVLQQTLSSLLHFDQATF